LAGAGLTGIPRLFKQLKDQAMLAGLTGDEIAALVALGTARSYAAGQCIERATSFGLASRSPSLNMANRKVE
jgi:hypothetical protein